MHGQADDYAKVHALQDKFSLVPLSYYGKPYTPVPGEVDNALDMNTAVRDQVDALGVTEYFYYLARLMKTIRLRRTMRPWSLRWRRLASCPDSTSMPTIVDY